MEILAENRFLLTKPLFLEGMLCISRNSYGNTARKCTLILLLVWVVMSVLLFSIGGNVFQALLYLFVILIFCFWLNVTAPRKHAKKAWDALVNRCGEDPERITRFFADHLEVDAGSIIKSVPYSDVLQIRHTGNLLMLICADKVGIMVEKNSFTTGSAEEITALIRSAA